MSALAAYLWGIGFLLAGLSFAAYLLGVPLLWIVIACAILLLGGIYFASSRLK